MKKEFKGFICGVLATAVVGLGVVSASGVWDNISVLRNDINVVVNGRDVTADNFLYNDTTYLPLRAVSEALNQSVSYDESTNTAYIGMGSPNQTVSNTNTEYAHYKEVTWCPDLGAMNKIVALNSASINEETMVGYKYEYDIVDVDIGSLRDALKTEGFAVDLNSNSDLRMYYKDNYRVTIQVDTQGRLVILTAVEMK